MCGFLILFALFHFSASFCWGFVPLFKESTGNFGLRPVNFVAPNEEYPTDAKIILTHAGSGIYLSVGTERAFMGFAMADKATHLMIVDADPKVIRFANINIALIAMAESLDEYRSLRFATSRKVWEQKIKNLRLPPEAFFHLGPQAFKFWRHNISKPGFQQFHDNNSSNMDSPYALSNYLYECGCFLRVHRAAQEGRIIARRVNFRDRESVNSMVEAIKSTNINLSVFDISNAWWSDYVDPAHHLMPTVNDVGSLADDDSLLLTTNSPFFKGVLPKTRKRKAWRYSAFTYRFLRENIKGDHNQLKLNLWEAKNGTIDLIPAYQTRIECSSILN